MTKVRKATIADVEGIREVFQSEYGDQYAYPQYFDTDVLTRLVYAESSLLLVAIDDETQRVAGTASVVFSVGAHNDLIGEFGRLVVHPEFRGRGIGKALMRARLDHVSPRLHLGIVENRAAHAFSQRISERSGFVPVGFVPMKLEVKRRESVAIYVQFFGDALQLRRNHPRIIPEAAALADYALSNCGLPRDAIIDDSSKSYPLFEGYELEELKTQGYASLLRIERGRIQHRDVFGPIRLHYGLFQLNARHSHYLIARREDRVVGGIGFMIDTAEKAVRVFELITVNDEPIRFLLEELLRRCERDLRVEYVEVDVSAYSPRMQRTLLELGFLPVSYVPANVFHDVERLDAIKMSRILVPFDLGELELLDPMNRIADSVVRSFQNREVIPRLSGVSKDTPLFQSMDEEQRRTLLGICSTESFSAGQAVFAKGDIDCMMHVVLSGTVQLQRDGETIAELTAGQCLGENTLLHSRCDPPPHRLTAIAASKVETAVFRCDRFHELIRRRPDIGVEVYRNLAIGLRDKLYS